MNKLLAATLVAATAFAGTVAVADTQTKTSTDSAKVQTTQTDTREQGGFLSRFLSFDVRDDATAKDAASKKDSKSAIRNRFEQPDVHLR